MKWIPCSIHKYKAITKDRQGLEKQNAKSRQVVSKERRRG
jgi:hypothetical protein